MSTSKKRNPTKWNTSSFRQAINMISPDIMVVGEYTNLASTIECKCMNCQMIWSPLAGNLIRGTKCPNCSIKYRRKAQITGVKRAKWNNESFSKRINEIDDNIELMDKFINTASKIRCRCKICDSE